MGLFSKNRNQFRVWWDTIAHNRVHYERAVTAGLPHAVGIDAKAQIAAELKLATIWQALKELIIVWDVSPTHPRHIEAVDTFVRAIRLNVSADYSRAWENVLYRTPKGKVLYPFDDLKHRAMERTTSFFLVDYWLTHAMNYAHIEHRATAFIGLPLTWELYQVQRSAIRDRALFFGLQNLREQLLGGINFDGLDYTAVEAALNMPEGLTEDYQHAPEAARRDFDAHKGELFSLNSNAFVSISRINDNKVSDGF